MVYNCQILSFLGFHCRNLNLSLTQFHFTIKLFCYFAELT